jgi:hypothetical protein
LEGKEMAQKGYFLVLGVIRLRHLTRGNQMVKCSKVEMRRLKVALLWKLPAGATPTHPDSALA